MPEENIPQEENKYALKDTTHPGGFLLTLCILFVFIILAGVGVYRQRGTSSSQAEVYIGEHTLTVDVADESSEWSQGLQGVEKLLPGDGMLFIFPTRDKHSFWMKDTFVALDIIWIDGETVVGIEKNVLPPDPGTQDIDLKRYIPDTPVNLVLELPSGSVSSLGIEVGDYIGYTY